MTPSELLVSGALQTLKYGERLLVGVQQESAARVPVVGGTTLTINHPTFVFGHLALYPGILGDILKISVRNTAPASYLSLFKIGCPCVDDPNGAVYPSLQEVTSLFFDGMREILEILPSLSDEALREPLQDEGRRERFGTVGAFLAYLLLAHPMTHFGQISAWRRCMNLGPA